MRYHVVYLTVGEREATHVEAPDAAAAVAAVEDVQARTQRAFELLSVVPERGDDPALAAPAGD